MTRDKILIKKLLYWPKNQDVLRQTSTSVDSYVSTNALSKTFFSDNVLMLANELVDTMVKNNGYGISAVQIGELKRIIVVTVDGEPRVMINPIIVNQSEERILVAEGCLSIPGYYGKVLRHKHVIVSYMDTSGNLQVLNTETLAPEKNELTSRCIQHEIDHLDGKLFIDDMSVLRQQQARNKVQKYFSAK